MEYSDKPLCSLYPIKADVYYSYCIATKTKSKCLVLSPEQPAAAISVLNFCKKHKLFLKKP